VVSQRAGGQAGDDSGRERCARFDLLPGAGIVPGSASAARLSESAWNWSPTSLVERPQRMRIERSPHDGPQGRVAYVAMALGILDAKLTSDRHTASWATSRRARGIDVLTLASISVSRNSQCGKASHQTVELRRCTCITS
jgi:hypothetical protein